MVNICVKDNGGARWGAGGWLHASFQCKFLRTRDRSSNVGLHHRGTFIVKGKNKGRKTSVVRRHSSIKTTTTTTKNGATLIVKHSPLTTTREDMVALQRPV